MLQTITLLKIHAGKGYLILGLGKSDSLKGRSGNGLVALIGERDIDRILMKPCKHKGVEFLPFGLVRGHQDIGDGLVDLLFILQTQLGRIVSVHRLPHGCQGGLRVIGRSPADIKYHVKITGLHIIPVGLLLLALDIQLDPQLPVLGLEILGNGLFRHTVAVVQKGHGHGLSVFFP